MIELDMLPALGPATKTETAALKSRAWTSGLIVQAVFAGALAAAAVAILFFAATRAYLTIPYSDVHDWIAQVFATERTHAWLGYLFEPHNAQRIPSARLVEALDIDTAKGRWPSFLLGGVVCWLMGCAALAGLVVRAPLSPTTKIVVGVLAGVMAANIGLAEDFAFPVFSVYLFVAGPALAALISFQVAAAKGLRSPAFWLALLFGVLASFGNAAGLAVWPALFVSALLQRRRAPEMAVLVLAGLGCIAFLETGLGMPGGAKAASGGGSHILKMIVYFMAFGGLPWSRGLHALSIGAVFGLCVWAAAAWGLIGAQAWRKDAASVMVQAGAAMIVFGLIAAVLATIGRVDELPQPIVPTRYTPFALVLQLGAVLVFARRLELVSESWRRIATVGGFALAIGMVAASPHGARAITRAADRIRAASDLFDKTGQQPDLVIHPRPDIAAGVRAELHVRGLPY